MSASFGYTTVTARTHWVGTVSFHAITVWYIKISTINRSEFMREDDKRMKRMASHYFDHFNSLIG
ncbi:hypothetical protein BC943DRAFT_313844 [Umbelopsis sp. AD052]|nr:hypothetical protein BC943DRAFT_313844 [Umbelopsis sp. AD052]